MQPRRSACVTARVCCAKVTPRSVLLITQRPLLKLFTVTYTAPVAVFTSSHCLSTPGVRKVTGEPRSQESPWSSLTRRPTFPSHRSTA